MAANAIPTDSQESREYSRQQRWLSQLDAGLSIALLAILFFTGLSHRLRDVSLEASGENYFLALGIYIALITIGMKIIGLPLDLYGYRLEHDYHLSNQRLSGWLGDQIKAAVLTIVLGTMVAQMVYLIIRSFPDAWWVLAWAAFVALFVIFAQLAPVLLFPLFYKFIPLEDEELKQRLVRLSEKAGTRVRGVYEWKLSEKSKKANAALTGLGATRRIILADTLLQNYSHDEIESVLAHELGHHVHRHIAWGMAVQAAVSLLGFWASSLVLDAAAREWQLIHDIHDFAGLPLLILVSSVLSLLLLPLLNAYLRKNEREADLYCWKSTASVQPFITAMNKLAEQNLSETTPSRLVEILFHSHPAVSKRIAAAEEFARRR